MARVVSLLITFFSLSTIIYALPYKTNDGKADNGSKDEKSLSLGVPPLPPSNNNVTLGSSSIPHDETLYGAEIKTHQPRRSPHHRVVVSNQSITRPPICLDPLSGGQSEIDNISLQKVIYYANQSRRIPINRPISPSHSSSRERRRQQQSLGKETKRKRRDASHLQPSISEPLSRHSIVETLSARGATSGEGPYTGGNEIGESSIANEEVATEDEKIEAAFEERGRLMASLRLEDQMRRDYLHRQEARNDRLVPNVPVMMPAVPPSQKPIPPRPLSKSARGKRPIAPLARYPPHQNAHQWEPSPSEDSSSIHGPWNKASSSDTSSGPPSSPDSPAPPPSSFQIEKKGEMITQG